jgi:hypothetical protein
MGGRVEAMNVVHEKMIPVLDINPQEALLGK